jgi:hypothetical protein
VAGGRVLDISYANETVYTLDDYVELEGEAGVGFYRLRFKFKATETIRPEAQEVALVWAEADVKVDNKLIGRLAQKGPPQLRTRVKNPIPSLSFVMEMDLDARRLSDLADLLSGRHPPQFNVEFTVLLSGPRGLRSSWHPGAFKSSADGWLGALQQAGFARTVLLDLVMPQSMAPSLAKALTAFDAGILASREGKTIADVLGHCWKACQEAGLKKDQLNVQVVGEGGSKRTEEWTLEDRLRLFHFGMYAFTAPGRHEIAPEGFGRAEARLALGLTALLLEYQSRKRDS